MKTCCIVQARLGSTRLPAKVLLPLPTGRTVLEEVLHRCKQIEGVDDVCLACTRQDMTILSNFVPQGYDLPIAIAAPECDENDVLGRYAKAAQVVGADIIIRITADCPLLNPHLCGEMLSYFKRNDLEFLSNAHPIRHVPHGWDCEIFTARLLALANSTATDPEDREHVTMALKKWADAGSITQHKWVCNEDWSDKRWTLDTLADYRRIVDLMRNDAGSTQVAA